MVRDIFKKEPNRSMNPDEASGLHRRAHVLRRTAALYCVVKAVPAGRQQTRAAHVHRPCCSETRL